MAHSDVRDLIAQKDAIEAEIKALSDVLDSVAIQQRCTSRPIPVLRLAKGRGNERAFGGHRRLSSSRHRHLFGPNCSK